MNILDIGLKKKLYLPHRGFLFIGDTIPKPPAASPRARRAHPVVVFDPKEHSFNLLEGLDDKSARELVDALYATSPEGENTLTVRNGRRALLQVLLTTTDLRHPDVRGLEKPDALEVKAMISNILASSTLRKVFTNPPNFVFNPDAQIFARINRAEIGDFAALVLTFVLITLYKGQLIIPNFGFYGRNSHINLIIENRLIAGVNYLGELPLRLRQAALLIKDKQGHGALLEDAKVLAEFAGHRPDPTRKDNDYNRFIDEAMA